MIVFSCKDLIFSTKIRSTAEHIGVPARGAGTPELVLARLNQVDDGKLNQPVTGVLVDLDLGEKALAIIETIKQHTPAIPVIAFGSHVAVDVLQAASEKGADAVMPRSQFVVKLPEMLQKYGGAEI